MTEKEKYIELIKDTFTRHGVKTKEDGRIVTYFTPDSASDFVEDMATQLLTPQSDIDVEGLAKKFHDTYERLAPSFGYHTRLETRVFDKDSSNGQLMIAVITELLPHITPTKEDIRKEAVEGFVKWFDKNWKYGYSFSEGDLESMSKRYLHSTETTEKGEE